MATEPIVNEWFGITLGYDGLLHVVSKSGYPLCNMGRNSRDLRIVEYGTPNCFQCYLRPWPRWFPEGFFNELA